jgi:hypothetical protein
MIYSAIVKEAGTDAGTWLVTPQYTTDDGQTALDIVALAADGIEPVAGDVVLCAESINDIVHNKARVFDDNGGANPVIIAIFSALFTTLCDMTIKGKATLGAGTEKMVLGDSTATWAQKVDAAIQALYTWGAGGVAPGPAGGISPFPGTPAAPVWAAANLSANHKLD